MREINGYYGGYNNSEERIDYLKYGLLNEYGINLESNSKSSYNEDSIIKKKCNLRTIPNENEQN